MTVSFIRTIFFYVILIIFLRIMGKRQLGELQTSEFAVTLLLANLAAIPMQAQSIPLISGLIPIATLLILEMIISFAVLKSRKLRMIISGRPIIIIENGKINQSVLKKLRINTDDLCEELRLSGISDIGDVACAVVEPNGQLSVFEAGGKGMFYSVIADGKTDTSAMKALNISQTELEKRIRKKGFGSISEIFLMCMSQRGEMFLEGKEK